MASKGSGLGVVLAVAVLSSAATAFVVVELTRPEPPPAVVPEPSPPPPRPTHIDAAQITSGRLPMERMAPEIGKALELQSEEIVKTAEALDTKQARITGTCAPGSAIRVIGEDGKVSCQRFPKGVVSVTALAGVPRLETTTTAPANVKGGVGRYQTGGEDDYLIVPIALPDGAIVTSFTYVYYDAVPAIDSAAFLYRSDDEALAAVRSSGASNEVRAVLTETIKHPKIDGGRYAYFVYFQMSAAAGDALLPISASVSYRLP